MKTNTRTDSAPRSHRRARRWGALTTAGVLAASALIAVATPSFAAPDEYIEDCTAVTGTVSDGAGWQRQQASQAWATAKLAASPRESEWVTIDLDGQTLKAWVDYPVGVEKAPVVIVGHEVFGLTDSTRNTADEIAAMGYIAITPDFVSGLGPDGGGDVQSLILNGSTTNLMISMTNDQVNARYDAWVDYAKNLPRSTGQVDIVGLSWSGGAAFRYAQTGTTDVNAIFVFYDVGAPTVNQGCHRAEGLMNYPVDDINVPIYGFYGETDTRVINSLPGTTALMAQYGKFYEPVVYAGADHAFFRVGETPTNTNPANVTAIQAALARLQTKLGESFGQTDGADGGIDVQATIAADAPGSLALTVADYGDHVTLEQGAAAGDRLRFAGQLPTVTVTDSRNDQQAAQGGWAVTGQASEFASPSATVSADHLAWTPHVVGTHDGVTAGRSVATYLSGGTGLASPSPLANATAAGRAGSTELTADLQLDLPVDAAPGTYSGTVTVSLFPVD